MKLFTSLVSMAVAVAFVGCAAKAVPTTEPVKSNKIEAAAKVVTPAVKPVEVKKEVVKAEPKKHAKHAKKHAKHVKKHKKHAKVCKKAVVTPTEAPKAEPTK